MSNLYFQVKLSQNTHYIVSDNNKLNLDFVVSSQQRQLGEVQVSRSENNLRDITELQTEMRKTEFALERGRNFPIGLYNQLYPLLDIELLKNACPQVISANCDWLFKGSETYRLFCFLQAVAKLAAD